MPNESRTILEKLEGHIQQLIAKYEAIRSDNALLTQEKSSLQNELENKNKLIKELENKIELLLLAKTFESSEINKKEGQQKIMRIVKEIDKCISLLNN